MAFIRGAREGATVSARRGRPRNHIRAAIFLVVASLMASITASAGDLDKVIDFNIDAQTLDKALLEFGAQAHVEIMFAPDSSTGALRARAIKGSYTGREALTALLKGTRLSYIAQGRTLEILPAPAADPRPTAGASKSSGSTRRPPSLNAAARAPKNPDPPVTDRSPTSREPPYALSEIIVTAQKYSQPAFDVPISLQVISGQELQQHGIASLSDLQHDVPGLYMNSTGYSQSVYLRGVGNSIGNSAMVGEYIDDADITAEGYNGAVGEATGDNGLYDLSRVEVLKGPQGTLYGDGAMGGVIRYITNKPALDRDELSTDLAALFTEYGAPSQHLKAMLNTPVVPGTFGLRFAGMFEHDGGWVDEPLADLKNINGSNLVDIRAEALWKPATRFQMNAMEIVHRHSYGIGTGETSSGIITPLLDTTFIPNGADDSTLSNLTLTYNTESAQLVSSSTYYKEQQDIHNLYSSESFGALTYWLLQPYSRGNNESYSEEFRLVHAGDGPWRASVGGFYKHFRYDIAENEYFGLAGSSLSSAFYTPAAPARGVSSSWAGFADTSYKVLGRLTLGAGIRYFKDRETYVAPEFPFSAATFSSTDPRFYVQYAATERANIYASASKGFRSGGFNLPPTAPYQPETLWSYDLGAKVRKPGNVEANVDAFYSSYSQFVQTVYIPPAYQNANIGKARIEGVDAGFTWRPLESWRLTANAEGLHTRFITASAISGYSAGDRVPFAPKYSLTASVGRDFRLGNRSGDAEVYYYQISGVQLRSPGVSVQESDTLRFLSARVAIELFYNARLSFSVDNLLNDRGVESPEAFVGDSVRPRPRTLGMELETTFE